MTKAKQELAQSSVPNGFSTTVTIDAGDADRSAMAQILQKSLAALNIKVTIRQADPSAVTTAEHSANFDMVFTYCTTDIVDPDEIVGSSRISTAARTRNTPSTTTPRSPR
jgi:peptide/nickel transport system substrate-binding protein